MRVIPPKAVAVAFCVGALGWIGAGIFTYWYQIYGPNWLERPDYKSFSAMVMWPGLCWGWTLVVLVGLAAWADNRGDL